MARGSVPGIGDSFEVSDPVIVVALIGVVLIVWIVLSQVNKAASNLETTAQNAAHDLNPFNWLAQAWTSISGSLSGGN